MPDTMITAATVQPFSPSAFVEQVIQAVLPFTDARGDNRKEGVTDSQLVEALKPLFGGFTVHDAVIAHFMLDPDSNTDVDDREGEGDNPRKHALYEAREILIRFITNAWASSPECAVTRIYLAEKEEDDLNDAPDSSLMQVMRDDVRSVRTGRFRGQRFAHTDRRTLGWCPWNMMAIDDSAEAAD
jgi:hypothetical protein